MGLKAQMNGYALRLIIEKAIDESKKINRKINKFIKKCQIREIRYYLKAKENS